MKQLGNKSFFWDLCIMYICVIDTKLDGYLMSHLLIVEGKEGVIVSYKLMDRKYKNNF